MAQQTGYILKKADSWFPRYRDAGKQRRKKLAEVSDQYRRTKDLEPLAAEFLAPFNSGKARPESWISVSEFAENNWLPWAKANCKPSTVSGCKAFYKLYLGPHMPKLSLRDFRNVDARQLFAEIYRQHKVSKRVLRNAKRIPRSIFSLEKTWGAFDGANPLVDAPLPMEAPAATPTHAASPDEVLTIMDVLRKACETELREADGNSADGPILRGRSDEPLLLDKVSQRVIIPLPRGCAVCGKPESRHNAAHAFKLDESLPTWHGFYSLRRGVASTFANLTKDVMASKGRLRHTKIAATMRYYVQDVPSNRQAGIDMLENLCNESATGTGARPN